MSEAYAAGPGAIMPAPDGGSPFTSTRVTAFRAGNQYLDRADGGQVRTVARLETIYRVVFDPLPGHPDHRDHSLSRPGEMHQWGRKGVPASPRHRAQASQDGLEASWEHRAAATAVGDSAYPGEDA